MATLAQILDELAAQIDAALFAIREDIQVEGRMIINPTPPCIDMWPADPSTEFGTAAFSDLINGELITVRARVATADNEAGQDLLLALMDDEDELSVVTAIMDDPTLNGLARVDVRDRSGYRDFPVPESGALLGCTWTVLALKERS